MLPLEEVVIWRYFSVFTHYFCLWPMAPKRMGIQTRLKLAQERFSWDAVVTMSGVPRNFWCLTLGQVSLSSIPSYWNLHTTAFKICMLLVGPITHRISSRCVLIAGAVDKWALFFNDMAYTSRWKEQELRQEKDCGSLKQANKGITILYRIQSQNLRLAPHLTGL